MDPEGTVPDATEPVALEPATVVWIAIVLVPDVKLKVDDPITTVVAEGQTVVEKLVETDSDSDSDDSESSDSVAAAVELAMVVWTGIVLVPDVKLKVDDPITTVVAEGQTVVENKVLASIVVWTGTVVRIGQVLVPAVKLKVDDPTTRVVADGQTVIRKLVETDATVAILCNYVSIRVPCFGSEIMYLLRYSVQRQC